MVKILNKKELDELKEKYPEGTRIILLEDVEDQYNKSLVKGVKGVVKHIDSIGTIFPNWDNGSTLGVVYGIDKIDIYTPEIGEDFTVFLEKNLKELAEAHIRAWKELYYRMQLSVIKESIRNKHDFSAESYIIETELGRVMSDDELHYFKKAFVDKVAVIFHKQI